MDEGSLADRFFSLWTVAFSALVMNGVALFKYWAPIMQRRNERLRDISSDKDIHLTRLQNEIARLDERFLSHVARWEEKERQWEQRDRQQQAVIDTLREELATERAERLKSDRLLQGEGEIRQAAQNAASEIRLEKKDEK